MSDHLQVTAAQLARAQLMLAERGGVTIILEPHGTSRDIIGVREPGDIDVVTVDRDGNTATPHEDARAQAFALLRNGAGVAATARAIGRSFPSMCAWDVREIVGGAAVATARERD